MFEDVVVDWERNDLDLVLNELSTGTAWIVQRVVSDGPAGSPALVWMRRVDLEEPYDPLRMLSGPLDCYVPAPVEGVPHAIAVTAGPLHSALLMSDGRVLVFGLNSSGQLGISQGEGMTFGIVSEPTWLATSGPVKGIAAGSNHTALVFGDGTVGLIGSAGDDPNRTGHFPMHQISSRGHQIADPKMSGAHRLRLVPGVHDAVAVAAGKEFTLILCRDGRLLIYGINDDVGHQTKGAMPEVLQIPLVEPAVEVSAGEHHALVLTASGAVYSFGSNPSGELGLDYSIRAAGPTRLSALPPATQVAAGERHSIVLLADGSVVGFGRNQSGELGAVFNSEFVTDTTHRVIPASTMNPVVALAAGGSSSMFVFRDGSVSGCGYNQHGQLGRPRNTLVHGVNSDAVVVNGLSDAVKVATGDAHTLVLLKTGQVMSFGSAEDGLLGRNATPYR